jgi:effector-binding domain-containing protein
MLTLPAKLRRKKQPYLSIRSQLGRRNLRRQAVLFFSELRDFMAVKGIDDIGPGFMRYLSIAKTGELDMEFGYLTARAYPGGGPVRSGILPSGTFMTAEWIGPYEKLGEVNAMLRGWAHHSGIELDITETNEATAYGCRMEIYHVSPKHTDDPAHFRTEIAVMTRANGEAGGADRPTQPGEESAPSFSHLPIGNWRNE